MPQVACRHPHDYHECQCFFYAECCKLREYLTLKVTPKVKFKVTKWKPMNNILLVPNSHYVLIMHGLQVIGNEVCDIAI